MTDRTDKECPCGGIAVPSLRYGPTPTPVDVHLCLDCGAETPPLPCCTRRAPPSPAANVVCPRCQQPFRMVPSKIADGRKHCSIACRRGWITKAPVLCPCGKEFTHPKKKKQTYCSVRCATAHGPWAYRVSSEARRAAGRVS